MIVSLSGSSLVLADIIATGTMNLSAFSGESKGTTKRAPSQGCSLFEPGRGIPHPGAFSRGQPATIRQWIVMQNSLSNGYLVLLRLQQGQVQHTFEKVRTPQHTGNYDLGIWKNLAITNISLHIKAVGVTGTIRVKCLIKVTRLILVTWMTVRVFPTHVKSLWSNNQINSQRYSYQVPALETCFQYVEAIGCDEKSV